MFDSRTEVGWYQDVEDMSTRGTPRFQTVILQNINNGGFVSTVNVNIGVDSKGNITPMQREVHILFEVLFKLIMNLDPNEDMLITLMIKRDNRKKHNSHEWFLGESGFGKYYKPEYLNGIVK